MLEIDTQFLLTLSRLAIKVTVDLSNWATQVSLDNVNIKQYS